MIKSEIFNFLIQQKNEDGNCPTGYMHFPEYIAESLSIYFMETLEIQSLDA